MRKSQRIAGFFCAAGLLASLTAPAFAAGPSAPAKVHAEMVSHTVMVEDTVVAFLDANGRSRRPVAYDNTIYIPLRTVGEWMGGDVTWDQENQTVHLTSGVRDPFYLNIFTPEGQPESTEEEDALYFYEMEHGMEVELRPDIKVTLNGTEQTFRNAAGKTVYPLVLRECVYLPVRNIGELCGKSVLWHSNPDGTMETLYLYDPPTDGQIQEAQAYLDRFDRELTAMEQALTAMQAKTIWSEEELRAEMESKFETPLAALTELTAPALGPVNGLMEGLRLRARDLLTNTVRPRIQPEEHMSPGAAAEYLQRDWQSHRDEFVPNVDKQLGWIEEQWQECRELLDAVIGNETPAAAQPSPQVVVKAVDGAKVRHIAGMVQIDLSGQSNQKIDSFAVSRGYGYWKIYVVNEGSAGLYVRITDDTGETLYRSETVAPGEAYSFASTTPLEEGSYYLLIHSADGGKALRGFLAYRQESRYQDLPA